jgi:hypothetical protein
LCIFRFHCIEITFDSALSSKIHHKFGQQNNLCNQNNAFSCREFVENLRTDQCSRIIYVIKTMPSVAENLRTDQSSRIIVYVIKTMPSVVENLKTTLELISAAFFLSRSALQNTCKRWLEFQIIGLCNS